LPFSLVDLPTPSAEEAQQRNATWVEATPGYFRTLGMRVDAGRTMTEADRAGSRPVVVINHQMAKKYWRHELNALGSHILIETETTPREVIGIVNDVRFWVHHEPSPTLYGPIAQTTAEPYTDFVVPIALHQNVAVRVSRESALTVEEIRQAVAETTDGLPLEHVRSMREAIYDASDNTPAYTILLTASAATALLLAAIGIFGVVSYGVSQRMHEIAVRVTLGASRRAILTLLLSTGARLASAGVVLGLLASLWATRLLTSELYEVSPTDPRVLLTGGLLLVAVVLVATWLPARRATHADPLVTLRAE